MTDQEIIRQIRKGNRNIPLKRLYKEFPKIKKLIISSGGNADIAQEIFNDSLIILLEKIDTEDFVLTSKLTTYLYGINRFLWKNELRKQNKKKELEWRDTLILNHEDLNYDEEKEEKIQLLEKLLNQITEKCKAIIQLFYFEKLSMKQIAERLNYSSVNSAKTQKYKCLENVSKQAKTTHL
ncbi:MAG: sigma-70 family RNA polymerase sigma factor [Flavobacteriales bacterium]|jgi:RNA polymerase sigma factor (sigma-70 family)|nr:sigma-70 family RNA polymerase sigma factor [Flavobacteriales bacterium]